MALSLNNDENIVIIAHRVVCALLEAFARKLSYLEFMKDPGVDAVMQDVWALPLEDRRRVLEEIRRTMSVGR